MPCPSFAKCGIQKMRNQTLQERLNFLKERRKPKWIYEITYYVSVMIGGTFI
jgi:hypothetical protein